MKLLMEFCEIAWQQHSYYLYNVIMMTQWILFCLFIITFSFSLLSRKDHNNEMSKYLQNSTELWDGIQQE